MSPRVIPPRSLKLTYPDGPLVEPVSRAKAVVVGLAAISIFVAPGVIFALLGLHFWGEDGVMLAFAPYGAGFVGYIAFLFGEDILEQQR